MVERLFHHILMCLPGGKSHLPALRHSGLCTLSWSVNPLQPSVPRGAHFLSLQCSELFGTESHEGPPLPPAQLRDPRFFFFLTDSCNLGTPNPASCESLFCQQWLFTGSNFIYTLPAPDGKESVCKAGDPGLIPGSGRSPGEGTGNPLQYLCLENPMDRGA